MKTKANQLVACFVAALALTLVQATAGAVRSGFDTAELLANDDESTGLVPLGFTINFFGQTYSQAYVNNNGNITFDGPLRTFTPFDLNRTSHVILSPFFADVDTRGFGSETVH